MVDLVGKPGDVHGPDSSINGGILSSMPSPFRISHLKGFQRPYMDNATCRSGIIQRHLSVFPENPVHAGKFAADILMIFFP